MLGVEATVVSKMYATPGFRELMAWWGKVGINVKPQSIMTDWHGSE